MQTNRKRTETICETATVLFVKKTSTASRAGWCGQCDADVLWIAVAALNLLGISGLTRGGTIHKSGEEICTRSLIREIQNGENI